MKHGFDDANKNKVEVLDKEETYALLAEAIRQGQLPVLPQDTAFVTMIKDAVTGVSHKIAFVTQAKYNELEAEEELIPNAYYFIIDDTTAEDLADHLDQNDDDIDSLEGRVTALEEAVPHDVGTFTSVEGIVGFIRACYQFWTNSQYPWVDCVGSVDGKRYRAKRSASREVYFYGYTTGYAIYAYDGGWAWKIEYFNKTSEIDPTSQITKAGLYAVGFQDIAEDTYVISIPDPLTTCYSVRNSKSDGSVHYAKFDNASKLIKIVVEEGGDEDEFTPNHIRLVAEY